jgi:hypothetical protein
VIIRDSLETGVVEYLVSQLSGYFHIKLEVWGEHLTGRKKRIDAIIYPKKLLTEQCFPQIPVGIEIKTDLLADGNKKQVAELYHQSIVYRHSRFELKTGREFLPMILIYPPLENYLKESEEFNKGFIHISTRLSGKFFIGELFLDRDLQNGLAFKIRLCGCDYYRFGKDGNGKRYNQNWGFEKYEAEKRKLQAFVSSSDEYDTEILKLTELLGI